MNKWKMDALPQAVLFDWDNTIVDNQSSIAEAVKRTFVYMGKDPSVYRPYSGPRMNYFQMHFADDWLEAESIFKQYITEVGVKNMNLFCGINELLQFLKSNSIYTAVVSNKLSQHLIEEVNHFNLGTFFNKVVGSGDSQSDKPSKEPVLTALDGSNIPMNEKAVFFIGDSIVDMECAKNAGIRGIIFKHDIPEYNGNQKVNDFNELLLYFNNLKLGNTI